MKYRKQYKVNADSMLHRRYSNQFGLPKLNVPADKAFWFFTAITISFFISQVLITFFIR